MGVSQAPQDRHRQGHHHGEVVTAARIGVENAAVLQVYSVEENVSIALFIDGICPGWRLRTRGAGGAASCKNFPKVPHGAKRDPERWSKHYTNEECKYTPAVIDKPIIYLALGLGSYFWEISQK